jgi:hypothetical protein
LPPPRFSRQPRDEAVLELVEYEITNEPMPHPLIRRLPPAERQRVDDIAIKTQKGRATVEECQALVDRHPDIPVVHNYLANAYQRARMNDKARECTEHTYRRFPDYLFGMINYASYLLADGRVEEVTAILNRRYSIHLWIRDRRCYHTSEIIAFHGLMVQYFDMVNKPEVSEGYLKIMKQLAPDHPTTRSVARRFGDSQTLRELQNLLKAMTGKGSRSRS